jgi:hypothetical protein
MSKAIGGGSRPSESRLMRSIPGLIPCVALFLSLAGCGSGSVTAYPVKGKITLDGKTMKGGGSIAFLPFGTQQGKAAGGEIAEDGTFQLTTYTPGDGSMVGEFRVIILQSADREPQATPDGKAAPKLVATVKPDERIPLIYGDAQQSPLKAKVEARSDNELNFDLKKSAGPARTIVNQGAMLRRDVTLASPRIS